MTGRTLGDVIAIRRVERGLLPRELAKMVGVDRSYITHIEKGTKKPGSELLIKIMSVLDLTFDDFYSEDDKERISAQEKAILESTMPFITYISECLTKEQFHKAMLLLQQTQQAEAAVRSQIQNTPMPLGPDRWMDLNKNDKALIQRIINRLLKLEEKQE